MHGFFIRWLNGRLILHVELTRKFDLIKAFVSSEPYINERGKSRGKKAGNCGVKGEKVGVKRERR